MSSDSESRDSDDGRRFRFEATRKDSVPPLDTDITTSSKKKSRHKSRDRESNRHSRDRKERSKYESGRRTDEDVRHAAKYSKHESWNFRQEDGNKDHVNVRNARSSNGGGDSRERLRDSKRQLDRDRSVHRVQRSREHSYDSRDHDQERASSDKHRSRCHERRKHHSRNKSRNRSHQLNRVRSPSADGRSRANHGKRESSEKMSVKGNRLQNFRDYSSSKNENIEKDSSLDVQNCKDLDLSQFDVLSETDENISDGSTDWQYRKRKLKRYNENQSENKYEKQAEKKQKKLHEMNAKNEDDDLASSSSNNNSSVVSASPLSNTSSAMVSAVKKTYTDSVKNKSEHCKKERTIAHNSSGRYSGSEESPPHFDDSLNEMRTLSKNIEQSKMTYGPVLPAEFASNVSDNEIFEKTATSSLNDNHCKVQSRTAPINEDCNCDERMSLIGPCLPTVDEVQNIESQSNSRQSGERGDAKNIAAETLNVFGPALPPHLMQRKCDDDSQNRLIGPMLPNSLQASGECSVASAESDDDNCAIGPLPADHPALRDSHVHKQLDLRAQRIKEQGYSEEADVKNKREEWMTELPELRANNVGLGPRKFRLRDGPDMSDRSCWTDTPTQKAKKQKDLKTRSIQDSNKKHIEEIYEEKARESSKHENTHHMRSLLEIHQSKMAKKKKKEEEEAKLTGISTRRPFDRNIDLKVHRVNKAQNKTMLMNAQLLNDRFSRGQI